VKGKISLTCDAWQASNVDAYFAVTGSWIEESNLANGRWVLQTTLLGFMQLNNAHNGVRLGQSLFQIVSRLGIAHRVSPIELVIERQERKPYAIQIGHVTCDNASNNNTMLEEFAKQIKMRTGKSFNPMTDRIR
jgi:hypothetical protein